MTSAQTDEAKTTRRPIHGVISVALLLLIWLLLWLPRLQGPLDLRWDASSYYVLGTALANGQGYRLLNEPGEIEAVQYPPLLPLIVAAHQRALGTSDYFTVGSSLRITYFILSGFYLLGTYLLARKLLSPPFPLLVAVVTALSFDSFLYPSEALYAELPFIFVSILFLLSQQSRRRAIVTLGGGLFAAAAYLLRTAGLALFAAWITESLLKRRFREAAIRSAIAAVPILLWQGHVASVLRSSEYQHPHYAYQRAPYYYPNVTYRENSTLADPFQPELGRMAWGSMIGRIFGNAVTLPLNLGESSFFGLYYWHPFLSKPHRRLDPFLPGNWRQLLSLALTGTLTAVGLVSLIGAGLTARTRHWFLSLYFALTMAMIILTPWQQQFWRYLAPLTPLTLIFLILASRQIRYRLGERYPAFRRPLSVLMLIIGAGLSITQVGVAVDLLHFMPRVSYYTSDGQEHRLKLLTYGSNWSALDKAFEWLRINDTNNAIVATSVPQLGYLRSKHKTVLPPFDPNPDSAARLLDQVPVDYIVLDQLGVPGVSERYAEPVIRRQPQNWSLVFTASDQKTRVYARVR